MQQLLEHIHRDLIVKLFPYADYVPMQVIYIGGLLVGATLIIIWMSLVAMGWIYAERKVAGYIQARLGPNRVGPYGILQSLADGIKLLSKEDIIPVTANRFLYELAPLLVFTGAFIPFAALPFSQHLVIADMDLGLFFVLAFGALEVVGILMAGWAPNSKWTLYGGMRLAAQMLSYEIPLGLSVLTVVVLSGTLNLTDMVLWQSRGFFLWDEWDTPWIMDFMNWSIFRAPWAVIPAFIIFYIAGLAESKRAPFDLPEAESELVAGFHTEYTGIRFSYFFLAEYCAMYVICALGAVVFLGGWHWPLPTSFYIENSNFIGRVTEGIGAHLVYQPVDGIGAVVANSWTVAKTVVWHGPITTLGVVFSGSSMKVIFNELFGFINLVGKAFVLLFIMLWIRWTLPRFRIDQVMRLCLKVLLPIGIACVLMASVQAVVSTPYHPYNIRNSFLPEAAVAAPVTGVSAKEPAASEEAGAAQKAAVEPTPAEAEKAPEPAVAVEAAPAAPAEPAAPKAAPSQPADDFDNF